MSNATETEKIIALYKMLKHEYVQNRLLALFSAIEKAKESGENLEEHCHFDVYEFCDDERTLCESLKEYGVFEDVEYDDEKKNIKISVNWQSFKTFHGLLKTLVDVNMNINTGDFVANLLIDKGVCAYCFSCKIYDWSDERIINLIFSPSTPEERKLSETVRRIHYFIALELTLSTLFSDPHEFKNVWDIDEQRPDETAKLRFWNDDVKEIFTDVFLGNLSGYMNDVSPHTAKCLAAFYDLIWTLLNNTEGILRRVLLGVVDYLLKHGKELNEEDFRSIFTKYEELKIAGRWLSVEKCSVEGAYLYYKNLYDKRREVWEEDLLFEIPKMMEILEDMPMKTEWSEKLMKDYKDEYFYSQQHTKVYGYVPILEDEANLMLIDFLKKTFGKWIDVEGLLSIGKVSFEDGTEPPDDVRRYEVEYVEMNEEEEIPQEEEPRENAQSKKKITQRLKVMIKRKGETADAPDNEAGD